MRRHAHAAGSPVRGLDVGRELMHDGRDLGAEKHERPREEDPHEQHRHERHGAPHKMKAAREVRRVEAE